MSKKIEEQTPIKEAMKPCPFCGCGEVEDCQTMSWWCRCMRCGCDAPSATSRAGARRIWNHRPKEKPQ